ncbi:MAG: methyl-accepting chemotaxis protein [Lachnospiraceae bacterium]|nr:methyl-accepting chemotaxis protein [Lachnospiraceae bacterium]
MFKFRKISTKLIVFLLTTFIIVLGLFLILVIDRTKTLADNLARDLVENAAQNHSNSMEVAFSQVDSLLVGLKTTAEQTTFINARNRREFLDMLLEGVIKDDTIAILGVWACFDPSYLDGLDVLLSTSSDAEDRRYATYYYRSDDKFHKTMLVDYDVPGIGDYYLIPYETGLPFTTDPYDLNLDGDTVRVISIAYPVKDSIGTVKGVIGVNYSLEGLNEINNQVELFETGYGKLVTDKAELVAHKNSSKVGTLDEDLSDPILGPSILAALQNNETFTEQLYSSTNEVKSYKAYTPVSLGNSGKSWVYAVIVSVDEVMADTNKMINQIIIIGIVGLLAAVSIIVLLARSISAPLRVMSKIATQIAGGNLIESVPEKYQKQQDEIGVLALDINKMRDELFHTVTGINHAMAIMETQVVSINDAIEHLNRNTADTSASTQELSVTMKETGESAEELNRTAIEIEEEVKNVALKAEGGAATSREIHSRATNLNTNINQSIEKSNQIFHQIEGHVESALQESKAVEEINALATAILSITSQTNLLALNASIEAARAGEAGKGFAVVANEISSLADNSKKTVTQIQVVTKTVMNAVASLSNSANELLEFVSEDVLKKFEEMLEAANLYMGDANYVSDMTNDLNNNAHILQKSIHTMLTEITEVSTTAQHGARATATIAGETTEIAENIKIVADNIGKTGDSFKELTDMVSMFRLK